MNHNNPPTSDDSSDEFSPAPLGSDAPGNTNPELTDHLDDELSQTVLHTDSLTTGQIADQKTRYEPGEDLPSELAELLRLSPPKREGSLGRLGTYEVVNVIGRGGMGIVARAFDEQLHRNVAIKVMSDRLVTSDRARRRFLREARAAASINHPNVVTIHAVSESITSPYLVMEYVEGITLDQRIRKDSPMAYEDVLRIGAQIAAGLAAAERHGVVHRDIKPANIMLEDGIERVKLTDFGLARLLVENSDLTSNGDMVGTPSYMSPEQVDGSELGPPSDLFSFGCVLYAMFLGKSPFHGSSSFSSARRVKEYTPPPLSSIDSNVPAKFDQLLARLMEKDPAKRPQSAAQVAKTLLEWSAETHRRSQGLVLPHESTGIRSWIRHLPMPVVALLGIILIITVIGAIMVSQRVTPQAMPTPIEIADAIADGELIVDSDDGEFASLQAAFSSAQPGMVVRVSPGRYRGPFELNSPKRLRDIQIIGSDGVILDAPGDAPVIRVSGVSGIRIEGIRIETRDYQNAINVVGSCPGLTIRNMQLIANQPHDNRVGLIRIDQGASGTEERPIEISECDLQGGGVGLVIGSQETGEDPVQHVDVHDNSIAAASADYGIPAVIQGSVRDIRLHQNSLIRGLGGISIRLLDDLAAQRVEIDHNTISGIENAFFLNESVVSQGLSIRDNLVVHARTIHAINGTPADFSPWFIGNQWIARTDSERAWIDTLFESIPESMLMSFDPESSDFLKPRQDTSITVVGRFSTGERVQAATE